MKIAIKPLQELGEDRNTALRALNQIVKDKNSCENYLNFVEEAASMADEYFGSHSNGLIDTGRNIPNRNASMSRIADMLGMGSLIAKANRMKLTDKDGYVREGVFQETAKGYDLGHPRADTPLYDIQGHPEYLDNPKLIRQLADLQILDYVCGNTDRHLKNMMYQIKKDENGSESKRTARDR